MSDRYRRGVDIVEKLSRGAIEDFLTSRVAEIAPDFARISIEFPFGDLYSRDAVDLLTREVVAMTALASLGHTAQLRVHVDAALKLGLSQRSVVEILMQCAVYAGFPIALSAIADCHDLLADAGCNGSRGKP